MSLLAEGEVLETRRLRIGIAKPVEIEDLAGWLEKALQPEWTFADLIRQVETGKCLGLHDVAGEPIGVVVTRRDQPAGRFASIPFIAVAPTRRFSGLGGEAAIAIERRLRAGGVQRVFAPVPDGRGLAVYFWLRLGYRPLLREEAPWPLASLNDVAPDGIWMVRDKD